jgi:hypothetical protein
MVNTYPNQRGLADKYLFAELADISADSDCAAPVPAQGVIVDAFVTLHGAITGADAVVVVSVWKDGEPTEIGTITAANASSELGSTFRMVVTGSEIARSVKAGDSVIFASGGESSTTAPATFCAVLREV